MRSVMESKKRECFDNIERFVTFTNHIALWHKIILHIIL